jgi:hypothetical protein
MGVHIGTWGSILGVHIGGSILGNCTIAKIPVTYIPYRNVLILTVPW